MKITVHGHRGVHHPFDLPHLFHDGLALIVQVFPRDGEGQDNGFHSLTKARAGSVFAIAVGGLIVIGCGIIRPTQ